MITLPPPPTPSYVLPGDHVLGPETAYLTIVHYGDFQCQVCVEIARALRLIQGRYTQDVRIVWRQFPQPANDKARLAAQAAEAAAEQGKFWEMHDQLLAAQAEWRDLPPDRFRERLSEYARLVRLPDVAAFEAALDGQTYATRVDSAANEARQRGFKAAPGLLFNDEPYEGRIEEFALDAFTRLRLLPKRQYARQPALQINLDHKYMATLVTTKGDIVIELFPRAAPAAVNSFVFLARQGWYDGNMFFLVNSEIAQTGDASDTGLGTAGYNIIDEHDNGLVFDREGVVAMAHPRGVENSASSQFFITYGPLPQEGFNKQYTIFGQVIQGMDVLRKLAPRQPFDEFGFANAPPGDRIVRVEIIESEPGN